MKNTMITAVAAGALWGAMPLAPAASMEPKEQPLVQIAILLDTSSSMSGLIEQAKGQLWRIVNEFIKARQNGVAPEVRVALYEYGKDTLPPATGWIRQIQPLTTDLDKISEELFALKTNGGEEYCGQVIKQAVEELQWSGSPRVYKAIFIAGNEPFTQGQVFYGDACKAAIAKGIIVNTIHCGTEAEGIGGKWNEGALLADGKYMVIDHNRAVVHFEAPQDQEIARLGGELNKTYLAYGVAGRESQARQVAQDMNALTLASQGAVFNRAVAKASANYRNGNWDLVDAAKENSVKLNELKAEDLPGEMRKMTETERKAYIDKKARERTDLQARIQKLSEERTRYVAQRAKEQAGTNTLDAVVISTVRQQAQKRDFSFE